MKSFCTRCSSFTVSILAFIVVLGLIGGWLWWSDQVRREQQPANGLTAEKIALMSRDEAIQALAVTSRALASETLADERRDSLKKQQRLLLEHFRTTATAGRGN